MGLKLHLPQPVAGGQVALSKINIVVVLGEYVRHRLVIEQHRHGSFCTVEVNFLAGIGFFFRVLPETNEGAK